MSAHTPGLWGLHEHMNSDPDKTGHTTECEHFTAHTIYISAGEKIICEVIAYDFRDNDQDCGYPRPSDFEENKANARLIAAAPELLEAIQRLVLHAHQLVSCSLPGDEHICEADIRRAEYAIAKATGASA